MINRVELADGAAVDLTGTLVELDGAAEPPIVAGYCVHCRDFATGRRYEATVPPDSHDLIDGHPGCPGDRKGRR